MTRVIMTRANYCSIPRSGFEACVLIQASSCNRMLQALLVLFKPSRLEQHDDTFQLLLPANLPLETFLLQTCCSKPAAGNLVVANLL